MSRLPDHCRPGGAVQRTRRGAHSRRRALHVPASPLGHLRGHPPHVPVSVTVTGSAGALTDAGQPLRSALAVLVSALCVLVLVILGGTVPASAGGPRPHAEPAVVPVTESTAPVKMELEDISPQTLTSADTLTVAVKVTNIQRATIPALSADMRVPTSRLTHRADLEKWQSATAPHTDGPVRTTALAGDLAPGESTVITLSVPASELNLSTEGALWGARRLSVTVESEGTPLRSLRTFTVWWPGEETAEIIGSPLEVSTLLPMWSPAPAQQLLDTEAYIANTSEGRLATLRQLAVRHDVDWVTDPSLLTPPRRVTDADGNAIIAEDSSTPTPDAVSPSDAGGAVTPTPDPSSAVSAPTEFSALPAAEDLAQELRAAADGRTIIGLPYARADVQALQDAATPELVNEAVNVTQSAWEQAGVTPRSSGVVIPGERATPDVVQDSVDSGVPVLILPQGSVRSDPAAPIIPSGAVALVDDNGEPVATLLTPDQSLSRELSAVKEDTDLEQARQRILAETAVVSGENLPVRRHLVMMPRIDETTSMESVSAILDALADAPWTESTHVSELLDAVEEESSLTYDALGDADAYFVPSPVTAEKIIPSALNEAGVVVQQQPAPDLPPLREEMLTSLDETVTQLLQQSAAMEDDAPVEAPLMLALAAVSKEHRNDAARQDQLTSAAASLMGHIDDSLVLQPASGYNLVADAAGVPITVRNDLGTPVQVTVSASVDRRVVAFGAPVTLTVAPYSQASATLPVTAIANGSVDLTVTMTAQGSDVPLVDPVTVPLTVNPAWENWTTLIIVALLSVLVVVGILRARRTGSEKRAPAERGPEPPLEDTPRRPSSSAKETP